MRYLITQTLLSSWNYMFMCHESVADDAYQEFLNTINRIPKPASEEMQNGIDFENEVYKEARNLPRTPHKKWENGIKAVATVIKYAPTQISVRRELTVGDTELLVYGILDALKGGVIYDVKFSNKSFGSAELAGKYLESPQHSTYLYLVPEAREFTYLVSDGEDLYLETYTQKNSRPLKDIVSEFLTSIDSMGLLDTYKEKWAVE